MVIINHRQHLVKLFVRVLDGLRLPPAGRRGRPFVYPPLVLLKCGLVMVYYRLTSLRSLERFLHQHSAVAHACGLTHQIPSYRTFSRRFRTLDTPALHAAQALIRRLVHRRWIRVAILATDASLLTAKGRPPNGKVADGRTGDRDAAWGYRATDGGWLWGYKLHTLSTVRPCPAPVAWSLTPANVNEGRWLPVVLRQRPRWRAGRPWCLGDAEYDSRRNVRACQRHRLRLVTPLKGNRWPRARMWPDRRRRLQTFRWWMRHKRYTRLRADIERLFSHLKAVFLLDPLPVKGRHGVRTYVNLVMVAYLAGVAYNGSVHRGLRAIKSLIA